MSDGPTAVVAALAAEMRPLAGRLRNPRRERRRGRRFVRGDLASHELVLAVSGDGRRAAGAGAGALLEEFRPRALLALGVAGGLSPDLPVAGLVAAREVEDRDGGLTADAGWLQRALATGRAVEGRVVSVGRVVATAEAKRRLWARSGRPERTAVDLESAAFARAAERQRVPWLVLRGVSDSAEEDLPLPFDRLAGADGSVRRSRVLAHLLPRPHRLPAVLALRRRVADVAERLADLVEELLA